MTWYTPMTGLQATAMFRVLGEGVDAPEAATMAYNYVGPGYFRTMGTKILMGREFERSERKQDICVLNQAAASFLFGHQRPSASTYEAWRRIRLLFEGVAQAPEEFRET